MPTETPNHNLSAKLHSFVSALKRLVIFQNVKEIKMSTKQIVNFIFENGTQVKSNISGFKGIITSRSQHLHSCNRYFVNPPVDKEGKLPDGYWFDEAELIEVKEPVLKPQNTHRGGPHSRVK